jgi:DNA polymerase-4
MGVHTIGELAEVPDGSLRRLLGDAVGHKLGSLAVNADPRPIETSRRARSVGAQSALGRRRATPELLRTSLAYLTDRVATRLRSAHRAGRTITVRVRFPGMRSVTRSATLGTPTSTTIVNVAVAVELAEAALRENGEHEITLLAVSVSNLVDERALQLQLPFGEPHGAHRRDLTGARWALDRAVDAARERFGRDAVRPAAVAFSDVAHVPEEFRQLVEHDP